MRGVVVPLRFRTDAGTLSLFSTTTIFGTPVDVTLSELAIESFFPADAATAEMLRAPARGSSERAERRPYIEGSSFGPVAAQMTRSGIGLCAFSSLLSVPNWLASHALQTSPLVAAIRRSISPAVAMLVSEEEIFSTFSDRQSNTMRCAR